jgi:hypothetical protein
LGALSKYLTSSAHSGYKTNAFLITRNSYG